MKTWKMLQRLLLGAVVVAVVSLGWAGHVDAQGAPPGSPPLGPTAGAQQVQGKITALDPSKGMLTLEDGTQLTIPRGAQLPPQIKEGAIVKASFEEHAGQKVLTALEVQQP